MTPHRKEKQRTGGFHPAARKIRFLRLYGGIPHRLKNKGRKKSVTHRPRAVRAALFVVTCVFCLLPAGLAPTSESLPSPASPEDALLEGLAVCADEIDLSPFALPADGLGALFTSVMNGNPELFYVSPSLSYTYDADGCVVSVLPSYTMRGQTRRDAQLLCLDVVSAAISELDACRSEAAAQGLPWSDADTLLFLHEFLTTRYDYDTSGSSFDVFTLFSTGRGVCQAYALALLALARAAGLEAQVITSSAMDHAWNLIRVDGAWYHVDVTRDDPIRPDGMEPVTTHTRLLLSDDAMRALGYHGFTTPEDRPCLSHVYEAPDGIARLAAVTSPLLRLPWGWYATDGTPQSNQLLTPVTLTDPPDTSADTSPDTSPAAAPVGLPGDIDRDGSLTPADLLLLRACQDRLPTQALLTNQRAALLPPLP